MSKVIVIGLDGATWDLINPWVENGYLPALKKIIAESSSGNLRSTFPPLTPPAWTSAFTGVNPGKHNIFDFIYLDGYQKRIIFSHHRRREAVWQILSKYNKKSIVINVPQTFPPDQLNGWMVSGMGTPSPDSEFTYPEAIKEEVINTGYIIDYGSLHDWVDHGNEFIETLIKMTNIRHQVSLKMLKKYEWDLFVVIFTSPDRAQHVYYKDTMEEKDYDNLLKVWKKLDSILGDYYEISKTMNAYLLIISDHGFAPIKKGIYLNNYFKELGLLQLKSDLKSMFLKNIGYNQANLQKVGWGLTKLGMRRLINFLPEDFRQKTMESESLIDWRKTSTWLSSVSGYAIRINLRHREPEGSLGPDQYEKLRNIIIEKLYDLKDNGCHAIKKCYKKEEIYAGNYLEYAPDILVEPADGYALQSGFGQAIFTIPYEGSVRRYADHAMNGIIIFSGPLVKENYELKNVHIYDITPTILYNFGLPMPDDLDGNPLTSAFKDSIPLQCPELKDDLKPISEHLSIEKSNLRKKIAALKRKGIL